MDELYKNYQEHVSSEIKDIDYLIDHRLFFVTKFGERYSESKSHDDFLRFKESVKALTDYIILRDNYFIFGYGEEN